MSRSMRRPRTRRWLVACGALMVMATGLVPFATVSAAGPTNAVLDWNQYAIEALSNPTTPPVTTPPTAPGAAQPPPVASIHLAMVHGAVYDAINAIDKQHKPYLKGLPSAPGSASMAAAAATAAHHVLVGLVPALPDAVKTNLDSLYAASLAAIPNGRAKTDGITIGSAAASKMLAKRAHDGRYGTFRFTAGTKPGQWRPELPSFVSDPNAWVAKVKPFTLKSRSQFRTKGPLAMTSARYTSEFYEVKAYGAATGSARNDLQTETANFFSVNPIPMYNKMLRQVSMDQNLSISRAARLFALESFSASDALINCFDDKAYWSFWRPITAIREAANDGNPQTLPQADWLPLLATPPYPDHPSGFNCYSGAFMQTAQTYFRGTHVSLKITSPGTMTTRTYSHFTDVLYETIDARVYLGIHFRTPDVQGADLGRKVARWVSGNFLERVH